ncbi:MAG: PfkB family carbohydrate kinase [Chthoniobacter sp.]
MHSEFLAFGEILWDCLPSGRHAGGAPFNVAAHLAQLGRSVSLISAVGRDPLGDEILQVATDKSVDITFVDRARIGLATGTVIVSLDADSNASYEIVQPAAWDEIPLGPKAQEAVAQARGVIFGSLAGRSLYNREQLDLLLGIAGPMKFFDVNLRAPFVDPPLVMRMARRADVIKVNDDELGQLLAWLKTGRLTSDTPRETSAVEAACARLAQETGAARICVTRAAEGAAFWDAGRFTCASAPAVTVRDTVGAGDAFMAGLMAGLTRGMPTPRLLEAACRLGACVAAQDGATPLLLPELIRQFAT